MHTARETARDTGNDIVEVKNLSGRPTAVLTWELMCEVGGFVCVYVCVEAGDGV